ncbi:3-oxoacyl-[acyl-carrier-protein] reductase FabG [Paraliobacillus ryukyuensis]|uniref:3-oxoacyl-[acyl-carrier protein] reductase n=1 Tax=Paraliobacillus ryukyuensis TaxID=200904 RepID=A0A366EEF6_9BACI|nr:SDR family oxidoreductase [Paraliobacillus ryukyuensis]RBO99798.1 3-oxoacyl-[acyl-carrier protein] reductase [Paraliobacillus ryukyuensis]
MTIFNETTLQGKHVLITGATGGIGYQTAITVAEMGAKVTITGRQEEKLKQLEQVLKEKNTQTEVFSYVADLAEPTEQQALIEQAQLTFGPITHLVNSAGAFADDKVEDLTQAQLEHTMYLNYTIPILLTQQVFPAMKKMNTGAIVNVSSLSGLRGTFGGTAYCGSKFALIGFTQSFALEAIQYGVRVNAVCPGFVETEMAYTAMRKKGMRANRSFEEQYEVSRQGLPSGHITTPKEVANTIVFLLTDAAKNIVGESVKISGGAVMR